MVIGKQHLEEQVRPTIVVVLVFLLLIKGTSIHTTVAIEKKLSGWFKYNFCFFSLSYFFCHRKLGWSRVLTAEATLLIKSTAGFYCPTSKALSDFRSCCLIEVYSNNLANCVKWSIFKWAMWGRWKAKKIKDIYQWLVVVFNRLTSWNKRVSRACKFNWRKFVKEVTPTD